MQRTTGNLGVTCVREPKKKTSKNLLLTTIQLTKNVNPLSRQTEIPVNTAVARDGG